MVDYVDWFANVLIVMLLIVLLVVEFEGCLFVGDLVLVVVFGGGFIWGAIVI